MKIIDKLIEKSKMPSLTSPITIAFLGDSVTHGCFEIIDLGNGNIDCVYDSENVYHNRLRKKINSVFPNCSVSVINAGISGDTAVGGAERVQRDVIEFGPDLAVVCFGLNDATKKDVNLYKNSLKKIFNSLKDANIETIFMTPNMMCTHGGMIQSTIKWLKEMAENCASIQEENGIMDEFMDAAREVCNQEGIIICDCYSDWKKLQSYGADITCLLSNHINHPTREMHELFADRLFECIFLNNKTKEDKAI